MRGNERYISSTLHLELFYCEDTSTHWYALKVFFNRVFAIEDFLSKKSFECYLPCEQAVSEHDGCRMTRRKPMISSLIFFRATMRQAQILQLELHDRAMLYTDLTDSERRPRAIPDKEMQIFMLVTSSGEKGMELVGDLPDFHKGQHVRVIDGPYKGAEGHIKRIKGNRRLIVSIQGVCAVLTAYIPQCFLEKLD